MSKATLKPKSEFCNMTALDIFSICLMKGNVNLNGKLYSITAVNDANDNEHYVLEWMYKNPYFYNFDFSKYDTYYDNIVVENILTKNNKWINDNYIDVLTCLFKNRYCIKFKLTASDNTKTVIMFINAVIFFHEITHLIARNIKSKFIAILANDEYREFVSDINDYDIEILFSLTKGDFLNKSYKVEFIKSFISLVGRNRCNFKSYRGQGFTREITKNSLIWRSAYFDYSDETLFFNVAFTGEQIGISFANNDIRFIIKGNLSNFLKEDIGRYSDTNFISQLFILKTKGYN